jgi:hypothetical protein
VAGYNNPEIAMGASMRTFVAFASAALATLSSGHVDAREVRTTFSFVVTIDERTWSYNDAMTENVNVLMPEGNPWHCVRQKLTLPADGMATGTLECSTDGGKTTVIVAASCGLGAENHHNSATLASPHAQVTVAANCNTSVYETQWLGF